jgi:hypothetical protein
LLEIKRKQLTTSENYGPIIGVSLGVGWGGNVVSGVYLIAEQRNLRLVDGEGGNNKKRFGKNKKEGPSDMDLVRDLTEDFVATKLKLY